MSDRRMLLNDSGATDQWKGDGEGRARVVSQDDPDLYNQLVASGTVVFQASDNLTTEKLSALITPVAGFRFQRGDGFAVQIDKPTEDTAGDLTVNLYNHQATVKQRLVTVTLAKITGAATNVQNNIEGLFLGDGTCQLGMSFAADSGAITVSYWIYRY